MICSSWENLKDSSQHVARKNLGLIVQMVLEVLGTSEERKFTRDPVISIADSPVS